MNIAANIAHSQLMHELMVPNGPPKVFPKYQTGVKATENELYHKKIHFNMY